MSSEAVVYIVDTDSKLRAALYALLETYDIPVQDYEDANSLLAALHTQNSVPGCLLLSQWALCYWSVASPNASLLFRPARSARGC